MGNNLAHCAKKCKFFDRIFLGKERGAGGGQLLALWIGMLGILGRLGILNRRWLVCNIPGADNKTEGMVGWHFEGETVGEFGKF